MENKSTTFFLWPLVTFISLLSYKRWVLGYSDLLYLNVVIDLILLAIMFLLSLKRQIKWVQWAQFFIAIMIILYHWADTCIFIAIKDRLTLDNVIGNYQYLDVIPYFISIKLIVFSVIIFILPIILHRITITIPYLSSSINIVSFELLVVLSIIFLILNNKSSINQQGDAINLINNSLNATKVTKSTLDEINRMYPKLIQRIDNYFAGNLWRKNLPVDIPKPNIIIVLSESLSMVDSTYAGGLFNRLPMIDKVQKEGLALKQAVANGKITSHGLAAFLLGIQTNKTGGFKSMLTQFPPEKFFENNIISYAKKAGYKTIVISGGQPPSFNGMTEWFNKVGFDEIYDRSSEAFSAAPRFTWNSPSDEAMYGVAEKILPNLKTPYLLLIETVSLHQPYILPDLKYQISNNDLLNQINYVDHTTYNFYEFIKKQGFLNNGIFILVGDHRRFESLEAEEVKEGGYAVWHERIICSLVGKGIESGISSTIPFSLVDMNTLLHYIIEGRVVDNNTLLEATLSKQLEINEPFSISLIDDNHGTYLLRNEKAPPLYISIFDMVPVDEIPYSIYKEATTYLIQNDQLIRKKLATSDMQGMQND